MNAEEAILKEVENTWKSFVRGKKTYESARASVESLYRVILFMNPEEFSAETISKVKAVSNALWEYDRNLATKAVAMLKVYEQSGVF